MIEHKILQWIQDQHQEMLDLLMTWAALPSSSSDLTGLAVMLDHLEMHFSSLGGKVERIPLAPRVSISSLGQQTTVQHGQALRITKRSNAPRHVLLAGHMDTVYSPGHPAPEISIDNAILRGPGVADMKGGLVVMLTALKALEKHPAADQIGWEVIINPDEEIGSVGSEPLFVKAAKRNQIGLIFEPSFADGAIVSSRKGSLNFTITAKGKAAHAGRDFDKGKNAIVAIAHFIAKSHRLNDVAKGISINPGNISGGGPVNIVPDLAICRFNIRALEPADFNRLKSELQAIANSNEVEGVQLSMHIDNIREPKPFDEKSRRLFELINRCAKEEGYLLSHRPSGGVCDGNILAAEGLPVIDTLGVIGGDIHTSNEYMLIDSLTQRSRLVGRFLLNLTTDDSLWNT